jgi:hypothetical protein
MATTTKSKKTGCAQPHIKSRESLTQMATYFPTSNDSEYIDFRTKMATTTKSKKPGCTQPHIQSQKSLTQKATTSKFTKTGCAQAEMPKRKSQVAADSPGKKKIGYWNKDNETLPDALNALEPKDIILIITEEIVLERECEPLSMGEKYYKAISIVIPTSYDGFREKETFSFGNLKIRHLRKVAGSLGVRTASRMVKYTILITIGKLSKIRVEVNDATNSVSPEGGAGCDTKRACGDTKRYNTIVRLINVIFS